MRDYTVAQPTAKSDMHLEFQFIHCPSCDKQEAQVDGLGVLHCYACLLEMDIYEQIRKGNYSFVNVDFLHELSQHGMPHLAENIRDVREKHLRLVRSEQRKRYARAYKHLYNQKYRKKSP